jgi:hypothetical protein
MGKRPSESQHRLTSYICMQADVFSQKSILTPFTMNSTVKILHVRRSGFYLIDPLRNLGPGLSNSYPPYSSPSSDHAISIPNTAHIVVENAEAAKIRALPTDLRDFCNWAFGPDGVSSLQVFAFGDFSFSGRYEEHNHLFCRCLEGGKTLGDDKNGLYVSFRPLMETDKRLLKRKLSIQSGITSQVTHLD